MITVLTGYPSTSLRLAIARSNPCCERVRLKAERDTSNSNLSESTSLRVARTGPANMPATRSESRTNNTLSICTCLRLDTSPK